MSSPPSAPPPFYRGPPYHYWSHRYPPPPPHHGSGDHHQYPRPPFGPGPHSPPIGPGHHEPHHNSAKQGYGWHPPPQCSGTYTWMEGRDGSVPHNAVKVGVDKDGSPIFAGRAFHEGDLLPAKVAPSHGGAFVAWGGGEHAKHEYEVLCSTHVGWTGAARGEVPPEAICVGQTSCGEKLYMGRVMHEGTLTPGKIQPSHGVLYIPFGGMEVNFPEYEVMVLM